jgi:hypothetical protein
MKSASRSSGSTSQPLLEKCALAVGGHDHLHAANCGHKSYVHAGHICFEHDGHYHYMHDGHSHECAGPFAGVQKSTRPVSVQDKPATVHRLKPNLKKTK